MGLGAFVGVAVGALVGWKVPDAPHVIGIGIGAVVGVVAVSFFLTPTLIPLILRTDFRRIR